VYCFIQVVSSQHVQNCVSAAAAGYKLPGGHSAADKLVKYDECSSKLILDDHRVPSAKYSPRLHPGADERTTAARMKRDEQHQRMRCEADDRAAAAARYMPVVFRLLWPRKYLQEPN